MSVLESTPSRNITAVLFDMDNTLFDFVEAKLAACTAVNRLLGLDKPMELIAYFLREDGHRFEDPAHIRDFMQDNGVYSESAYAECCRVYDQVKLDTIRPYPKMAQTLGSLKKKGLFLSVVTDAVRNNAATRLKKTGLYPLFDAVISSDMTHAFKPDPQVFLAALEILERSPSEVLLVGDSLRRDIGPAKQIGIMTAYAGYGDRNFHEVRSERADFTLDRIEDILKIVS